MSHSELLQMDLCHIKQLQLVLLLVQMSMVYCNDLEYVSVLASLPPQSIFEYLVGHWKRINTAKLILLKKVL
ncbi:hypothetical protein BDR06DRAFT_951885 [Suillus hirtellus]|nr:hypothetical protein BDR06DRAFT_951885 [Suillus hirtellus]